ncbi:uncharacterized protein LOC135963593 [Calliphora vicina]|uniref:uncharacterized protein LOC135963593 n=1 Tax=Calliphora vicina TaxID=7373 RepID=UPI00325AA8CD
MSSFDYNTNAAPDMLQLNMENISKELNDLIVTGEQEIGIIHEFSKTTTSVPPSAITTPVLQSNFQVPTYSKRTFHGQPHPYATNGMQYMKHNLNYYPTLQQPMACVNNSFNNFAATQTCYTPTNYLSAEKHINHSSLASSQALYTNTSSSPTYEFHYLRSNEENGKKFSNSCSSLGSNGAYRKAPRYAHKHFNQKVQNTTTENEQIKVDLSVFDFESSGKETSIVHYIFDLLRDLHRAVAEKPPSYETNEDSQYVETFAPSDTKSTMSSTLNVQNQVKQACRKLTIFICDMQRLLAANKGFDLKMDAECEYYLGNLRQYLNQLEMYKLIEMEHKRGQFLKEKVKAQAERLSLLLEHINRQIREVHIRIVAFDWYIGVKYRGDVQAAAAIQPINNVNDNKENSKIGVINEILQLCNTTTITATSTISTASLNTQTTKPEIITTLNSPTKLINNNNINNKEAEVNVKPPLLNENTNKNNNIFNVYKPDQIRRAASANSHNRHPVFYIG